MTGFAPGERVAVRDDSGRTLFYGTVSSANPPYVFWHRVDFSGKFIDLPPRYQVVPVPDSEAARMEAQEKQVITDECRYRKALEEILAEVSSPPYTVTGRKAWIRDTCEEALCVGYYKPLSEEEKAPWVVRGGIVLKGTPVQEEGGDSS